ncbi:MAG: amidohydrolase family protein [Thermoplasmatales archaeon]
MKIATGTDLVGTFDEPHGSNWKEILYLSEIIGNESAMKAATSSAADCVGLTNIGSIKKGFRADIIAVKGNPLENPMALNPENIVLVIKGGQVVKNLL